MSSGFDKEKEPRKEGPKFEEFTIPPTGTSPITGLQDTPTWGSLNKPSQYSRYSIGDADSDDEYNFLPMGGHKLQVPGPGATIATLAAPIIWQTAIYFNANIQIFSLCTNGNVYQTSTSGVTVTVGTGFTTAGIVDIACWQGTTIILSDSIAQKVYSWNGTTLSTVFTSQPVNYIAVFQGRLWMGINSTVQWTNINTFNSLVGDSGSYLVTDSNATTPITCMLDTPYGLLVSGPNWFKTITNLIDQGSPAALSFNQPTIEAQVGILTKWSVIVIGNVIFFANTAGIWAFTGSQPSQISNPALNGFFSNLDFTHTSLSASYGMINGQPCLFYQAYYKGDTQVSAGYTVFGYTLESQQWFRYVNGTISWVTGLVSAGSSNNNPTVWGCDGTNIFTLFTNFSSSLNAVWNGKLWSLGSVLDYDHVLGVAIELIANSATTVTVSQLDETNNVQFTPPTQSVTPGVITIINNFGQVIQIVNNSFVDINILANVTATYFLYQSDGLGRVRRFALNVLINGSGVVLNAVVLSIHRTGAGRGS